jgi:hypothetical protein
MKFERKLPDNGGSYETRVFLGWKACEITHVAQPRSGMGRQCWSSLQRAHSFSDSFSDVDENI